MTQGFNLMLLLNILGGVIIIAAIAYVAILAIAAIRCFWEYWF